MRENIIIIILGCVLGTGVSSCAKEAADDTSSAALLAATTASKGNDSNLLTLAPRCESYRGKVCAEWAGIHHQVCCVDDVCVEVAEGVPCAGEIQNCYTVYDEDGKEIGYDCGN